MEPIRVLHIVTSMNMGGIENFIMNTYRNIDRSLVQFDFLKHRSTHDFFDDEIISLGGKIYSVPPINPLKSTRYEKAVLDFLKEHKDEYSIIHSHINTFSAYPLRIAKKAGVPVRIAHAHATTTRIDLKTPFRIYTKKIINKQITDAFACSEKAGKWLFGDFKYNIIPNAINIDKYTPNEEVRNSMREKLGVSNSYVIGMVANFSSIKNHKFIVNVFSKVIKTIPNARLIFVGDGSTRLNIEEQVRNLNLTKNVIFTGIQKDITRYLNAFDTFVLPSISEGFPISVLEAETIGLPCVLSTGVPTDVKLFEEMKTDFISVEDEGLWVDKLISLKGNAKKSFVKEVSKTSFNANKNAENLMRFYIEKYESCKNKGHI